MKKRSKTDWKRIEALRDTDIDLSDNPELGADFFPRAVRWPASKQPISLRLDPDVLAFFRKQGRGYQSTINILLRRYMEAHQQQSERHSPNRNTIKRRSTTLKAR